MLCCMPEISRFLGIVVSILYDDHNPPHFHAKYGQHEITVDILNGRVTGWFPPRPLRYVLEWQALHELELLNDWHRASDHRPLIPIAPLE